MIARFVFAATIMCIPNVVFGASLDCSIRANKGTPSSALPALAKISHADAERNARASLKAAKAVSVAKSELEVEKGCLVWSFDLKIANQKGTREVWIDAGDGKILLSTHETVGQEAAEKRKDALHGRY
jgi:hypothetical protein